MNEQLIIEGRLIRWSRLSSIIIHIYTILCINNDPYWFLITTINHYPIVS